MTLKLRHIVRIASVLFLFPSIAQACECGSWQPSQRYAAPYIFIGKISGGLQVTTRPDGGVGGIRSTIVLTVDRQLRGKPTKEIRIEADGFLDCIFDYKLERSYLFFDDGTGSSLHLCDSPTSLEEASNELQYVERLIGGSPQGLVFGFVLQRDLVGGVTIVPKPETIAVVFDDGKGPPIRQAIIRTNRYQTGVVPGSYQIWIERDGKTITNRETVRVENGKDLQHDFILPAEK